VERIELPRGHFVNFRGIVTSVETNGKL
jgi:hypothetical protein